MSYRNILRWKNPHRHPRNRTLLVLSPLLENLAGALHRACKRNPGPDSAILWLGFGGGGHSSSWRAPAPVAARPTGPFCPARGAGGLLAEAVVGHLLLVGVEVPRFDILGAQRKNGAGLT